MAVAFLDFDHTLLAADSNALWMHFLQQQQAVSPAQLAEHQRYLDDYAAGQLDFAAMQRFRIALDAGLPAAQLAKWRQAFNRDVLLPAIAPDAPALLQNLAAQGLQPVMITATRAVLAWPVCAALGIRVLLCADDQLAEQPAVSCFAAGKVVHAEAWLKPRGLRLADCHFYSDSHNDLPLMQAVGFAHAVDADPQLAAIAQQHGWPQSSLLNT